ncbi:MAG TPA: DUF2937 family protein [Acetobacteraceae bacterium]|nr:DUF2937 family protein [Acetobacteraceae bacterium]
MGGFIARWVSDAIRLALSLAFAVAAMQVPALTHDYAAALLQIANDERRDIDQRAAAARQFYHLKADTDEALIAALKPLEPSNAQGLAVSVDRTRTLRTGYDRIEAAPPLLRPITALADAIADATGYKGPVLWTAFGIFTPEVVISTASAVYGLVGLIVGSFVAQVLISLPGSLARRRSADDAGQKRSVPAGRAG